MTLSFIVLLVNSKMAPLALHFLSSPKAFHQDMESHLYFRCNAKETYWRAKDIDSLLMVVTMVVCLSFLGILMVPNGLQKRLGLEAAKEAMDSVWFVVFVVMDILSFLSSMGVILVLLQAIPMYNTSNVVIRICGFVAEIAMGCATIAFLSALAVFTWHL